MHELLAQVHADMPQHEYQDRRMLFSTVKKGANGVEVQSEWAIATELLDNNWSDMVTDPVPVENEHKSLYVIRLADLDVVKIGYSENVSKRLSCLQVGCPLDLHLEFTVLVYEAERWEKVVHDFLKKQGKHIRGEWFRLPKPLDMFTLLKECGL